MAKSSPTHGILSRYVASTPSFFQVVNVLVRNHVSEIKSTFPYWFRYHFLDSSDNRPQQLSGVGPHSGVGKGIYVFGNTLCI
jgi:hypothetical protein